MFLVIMFIIPTWVVLKSREIYHVPTLWQLLPAVNSVHQDMLLHATHFFMSLNILTRVYPVLCLTPSTGNCCFYQQWRLTSDQASPSGFSWSYCLQVKCRFGPSRDLVGTSRTSWGDRPESQGIVVCHLREQLRQWVKEGKTQLQLTCHS